VSDVVFYGDLNCPFCYAENERLLELGLADEVPFRAVQHWPNLPAPWNDRDPYVQSLIDEVLPLVRELAEEVPVERPRSCPNTKQACIAVAEATLIDPKRATKLRTALFRALWRDGRDLSEDEVITEA